MRARVLSLLALAASLVPLSPPNGWGSDCSTTSVGLVPLNDLGAGSYQGFPGGLYPSGLNVPPPGHHFAGRQQAAQVVPRDAAGLPSATGSIVLLSIGMSNATQEFAFFKQLADADPAKDAQVVIVDGAEGGQSAEVIANPNAAYWTTVMNRLAQAGVTAEQVQVLWLKEALAGPMSGFPKHAEDLRDLLKSISQILRSKFPNARLCYLASRTYAGYATTQLNPEPYAYEQGFAVKWLIAQQIAGDPGLNFAPGAPITAPWLGWGTYNWADGLNPRSDGLTYACSDFQSDGTHPAAGARQKVADALLAFLKTDATAKTWFLAAPTTLCPVEALMGPYGGEVAGPNGATKLVLSDPPQLPTVKKVMVHAWGAPSGAAAAVVFGLSPLPAGQVPMFGGSLLVTPFLVVTLTTDSFGKAWLSLGALPDDPTLCDVSVYFQAVVADPDSPAGYDVTRGLRVRFGS